MRAREGRGGVGFRGISEGAVFSTKLYHLPGDCSQHYPLARTVPRPRLFLPQINWWSCRPQKNTYILSKRFWGDDLIGANRFIRNFRRLLMIFSCGLKEQAGETLQFLAARFIRWKARFIADMNKKKKRYIAINEAETQNHALGRSSCTRNERIIEDESKNDD
ncbi:hypothetical protein MPH_03439 [Macrophomina phaseolina MS6]|uniref:Uncharacterized protein n=1 Tax=Macrophomina phaseolina (strain MS6) TaxID=1126212 RepID=K2SSC2_MACPH|nr:hypothetical protein MPH_03439 [Macrophomina phaseolina MS6]